MARSLAWKRQLGGAALILGPALFIVADYFYFVREQRFLSSVVGLVSMVVWLPAILALYHLFRGRADLWGVIAAGICLTGALAVYSIIGHGLTGVAIEQVAANAPDRLADATTARSEMMGKYILPPGVLFPLGLLLFAVGLVRYRLIPLWAGLLWCAGAVFYPAGRIPDTAFTVLASDALLMAAAGWLGLRLFRDQDLWEGVESVDFASNRGKLPQY